MLKILNILCLICISSALFAQTKKSKKLSIEEQDLLMEQNSHCLHTNKYNAAQRKQFYPFNQTEFISIISFQDTISEFSSHLPLKEVVIDMGMVKEEVKLSLKDIDKLTDLFYNTGYTSKKYGVITTRMSCYDPHNAILFFNKERKVISFIEICFDCHRTRASSENVHFGENCTEKFDKLKDFFTSNGIKLVSVNYKDEQ